MDDKDIRSNLIEIWKEECKLNALRDNGDILMWFTEQDGTLHVCVTEEECFVFSTNSKGLNPEINEEAIEEFLSLAFDLCLFREITEYLGYYVADQDILQKLRPMITEYAALWENENVVIRQSDTTEEQALLGDKIGVLLESYGVKSDMDDGNFYFITKDDFKRYCLIFCDDFRIVLQKIP